MLKGYRYTLLFLLLVSNAWGIEDPPKNSLTLAVAIEIALQNNAAIKEMEAVSSAAEAGVRAARADFLPKASAHYNYSRLEDAPFQRIGGDPRFVGDENAHHWDVTLVQPLFKGFGIISRHEMATLTDAMRRNEKNQVILDICREVKVAWFESLLSEKILTVAEENVSALSAHEKDAEGFFRHGLIARNDLLKSKVALANAVQEREKSRSARAVSRSALKTIMGIELKEDYLQEDITDTSPPKAFDLSALTEEALHNRPYLASLRLNVDYLEKSVKAARSALYPEIALIGRYEENGEDLGARKNDYSNGHNASVTLQAAWTFFEWGKTTAEVSRQNALKTAMIEKVRGAEDRVKLETETALSALRVAESNIATSTEALEQARENWRITNLQYQNQVTTSTEVLDSRAFLTQAETNYIRARYGYQIALAKLENAVGRR